MASLNKFRSIIFASLYHTHTIICKFPQSILSMGKGIYWSMCKNKKADIEYPFEHGEVIHYTLDGVSILPFTTKILASFLTQLPERKETNSSEISP